MPSQDLSAVTNLIPAEELAEAIKLAFRTLVAIMSDKRAPARERRTAATTILRLTTARRDPGPDSGGGAKVRVEKPQTPPSPSGSAEGVGGGEGSTPTSTPTLRRPSTPAGEQPPAPPIVIPLNDSDIPPASGAGSTRGHTGGGARRLAPPLG